MENVIDITDRLPKADIKANIDKPIVERLLDILEMNLIELQTEQSDGEE